MSYMTTEDKLKWMGEKERERENLDYKLDRLHSELENNKHRKHLPVIIDPSHSRELRIDVRIELLRIIYEDYHNQANELSVEVGNKLKEWSQQQ